MVLDDTEVLALTLWAVVFDETEVALTLVFLDVTEVAALTLWAVVLELTEVAALTLRAVV